MRLILAYFVLYNVGLGLLGLPWFSIYIGAAGLCICAFTCFHVYKKTDRMMFPFYVYVVSCSRQLFRLTETSENREGVLRVNGSEAERTKNRSIREMVHVFQLFTILWLLFLGGYFFFVNIFHKKLVKGERNVLLYKRKKQMQNK